MKILDLLKKCFSLGLTILSNFAELYFNEKSRM